MARAAAPATTSRKLLVCHAGTPHAKTPKAGARAKPSGPRRPTSQPGIGVASIHGERRPHRATQPAATSPIRL